MDLFTALAVTIPSTLSLVTSLIYAVIAIKKAKEPLRDEVWETALRLMCSKDDCYSSADDFASLYLQLKFFKDQPEKMKDGAALQILRELKPESYFEVCA